MSVLSVVHEGTRHLLGSTMIMLLHERPATVLYILLRDPYAGSGIEGLGAQPSRLRNFLKPLLLFEAIL